MTIIDPAPVLDPPSGAGAQAQSDSILNEILVKIGLSPAPAPGAPSAPPPQPKINWPQVQAYLQYAWPGYNWPSTFNAELIATNYADILGRLGAEAQYNWQTGIALQMEIAILTHLLTILQTDVSALEAGAAGAVPPSVLANGIAAANATIASVAADLAGLHAWLNTQLLPTVTYDNWLAGVTAADLKGLHNWLNAQLVPTVQYDNWLAGQTAADLSGLHSWLNGVLVPTVGNLSSGLTAETARAQQTEGTLHGEIANETARATGVESNILGVAIPSAVAALATQVETELQPVRDELSTCVAPLCDTVTPNAKQLGRLGGLLKALEGLGIAAVLAGLVAEAVTDPDAASSAVIDVGGWLDGFAVDLVDAL